MTYTAISRRSLLRGGTAGALGATVSSFAPTAATGPRPTGPRGLDRALANLERASGRTIGAVAGARSRTSYRYRADQRFPMCSLFKTLLVGLLLRDHAYDDGFWRRRVTFSVDDIVVNSLVCASDHDRNMSVSELADATLRYSDNTAGNLLLRLVGGPMAVTRFATDLGVRNTRLDRWEPELNVVAPGDPRDTSTPSDIHRLYGRLLVGDALDRLGQARLRDWMLRNTTARNRLGRALPQGAELADKTGAGAYGVVNDAGVFWRGDDLLSIVVMTRTDDPSASNQDDVVAQVGALLVDSFLPGR